MSLHISFWIANMVISVVSIVVLAVLLIVYSRNFFHLLLNLRPYLLKILEVDLKPGRQEVQGAVGLVMRRHDDVVLDEHAQVVAHGLVVQLEGGRQGVRVVGTLADQVDDLCAVQPPPRAYNQMPKAPVHWTARRLGMPHMYVSRKRQGSVGKRSRGPRVSKRRDV